MEIGNQIKERRLELKLTQEGLANKLNVARSTVSNWEIGRNYPDIQLIVLISNELELSLDKLLKEKSTVVKEIARDTQVRKSQSRKIKILSATIVLLVLAGIFGIYKSYEYQDVSSPDQIVSVKVQDGRLDIVTDLPFYLSVVGYMVGNSPGKNDTIEISLSSKIDFSMENKQELSVETESLKEDMNIKEIKKINFIDRNGIIKSFEF